MLPPEVSPDVASELHAAIKAGKQVNRPRDTPRAWPPLTVHTLTVKLQDFVHLIHEHLSAPSEEPHRSADEHQREGETQQAKDENRRRVAGAVPSHRGARSSSTPFTRARIWSSVPFTRARIWSSVPFTRAHAHTRALITFACS